MDKAKASKLGLGTLGIATAIGVGAAFGPGIASAQVADADVTEESTEESSQDRGEKRGNLRAAKGEVLEELGLDADVVKEGRQEGLTLAEIAEAQGVSEDALVGAIVSQIEELAEENDRELDKTTEELTESVTEKVNSVREKRSRFGKAAKFGGENKQQIREAIQAEDFETARELMLDNVASALEAGDIDEDRAAALTQQIEGKDFSEGFGKRRGSRSKATAETSFTA